MITMRRLAAGLFCFFLIYVGAAEALKGCLDHEGISDHHVEGHHSDSGILAAHDHSSSPSGSVIHCPTPERRLGPALQVASPNLNRFELVSSVHPSSFPKPGSLVSKNSLWLEALFKRIRAFSLPNDLARHLFLSILQI
jgi:hypothetical protein